jgi:hypothetical protein
MIMLLNAVIPYILLAPAIALAVILIHVLLDILSTKE